MNFSEFEKLEKIKLHPKEYQTFVLENGQISFGTISPLGPHNKSVRGICYCRGYLHDDLRSEYLKGPFSQEIFEKEPYRLFVGIRKDNPHLLTNFLSNWEWFKSWQKFLNLQEPIIKKVTNENQQNFIRIYLEIDPVWQKGILQNSFCSFILRTMGYYIYTEKIKYKKIYECLPYRTQDILTRFKPDSFYYYLNNIHLIKRKFPYGKKDEDFWTSHDTYGFIYQEPEIESTKNFLTFLDLYFKKSFKE